jgi:hypothetical protein
LTAPFGSPQQAADAALAEVLDGLAARGYQFVSPTPGTHRLVRDRHGATGRDVLRDVFGWTRPFAPPDLDPALLAMVRRAGVVEETEEGLKLTIRVSTLDHRLYLHSAPTPSRDAVFLGPDSYRFARFLRGRLSGGAPFREALDIGTGAGVGALTLAAACPESRVTASDINSEALRLCRINATHNRLPVTLAECSGLPTQPLRFDVIAANPPYVAGPLTRTYRDGGGPLGAGLALDWVEAGLPRLSPGGRFLLYTGSAIVRGEDMIRNELERLAARGGYALDYEEIDPDVFGGTLRQEAYAEVERIAAVGAVLTAA